MKYECWNWDFRFILKFKSDSPSIYETKPHFSLSLFKAQSYSFAVLQSEFSCLSKISFISALSHLKSFSQTVCIPFHIFGILPTFILKCATFKIFVPMRKSTYRLLFYFFMRFILSICFFSQLKIEWTMKYLKYGDDLREPVF